MCVCAAPRVENVQLAIQHIWPLVYQYRMDSATDISQDNITKTQMFVMPGNNTRQSGYKRKRKKPSGAAPPRKIHYYMVDSDGEMWSDTTDEELNSEEEGELMIDEDEEEY